MGLLVEPRAKKGFCLRDGLRPEFEVNTQKARARNRQLRRLIPKLADESMAKETQRLHKTVHNNVSGPKRRKFESGVGTSLPVGVRSGHLRRAIKKKKFKRFVYRVFVDQTKAKYAHWVEHGVRGGKLVTAPTARGKKAFAWVLRGRRPHGTDGLAWRRKIKRGTAVVTRKFRVKSRAGTYFFRTSVRQFSKGHVRRLRKDLFKRVKKVWT